MKALFGQFAHPSTAGSLAGPMACLLLHRLSGGPSPDPATTTHCHMPPNIPTYPTSTRTGVNCWQCRHFATSWDPALPYSCKLLGFKSRMLPCMQVQQLDGRACQGFEPKPTAAKVSANRQ